MSRRLAEVAKKVGVSEATVSRVLNEKPGVSEATRQAVLTALDVLGYERPTKLRGERARLVGLFLPELQNPIFPAFGEVVGGAEQQPDALVAELLEVAPGLLDGDGVVGRHRRHTDARDGSVGHDGGKTQVDEPLVVRVRRVLLGVLAAGEHDPRHLLLQEEVDVVRLRDAARRHGAQHRRVAVLGEGAPDDLAEGGEDRVLQLGQEEPDEPRPFAAQFARPLVAEHVERGEHRGARARPHPRFVVEHPAHGGFADPDLARHIGETSRHGASLRKLRNILQCTGCPGSRALAAAVIAAASPRDVSARPPQNLPPVR